jgi:hypothetical protein
MYSLNTRDIHLTDSNTQHRMRKTQMQSSNVRKTYISVSSSLSDVKSSTQRRAG